MLLNILKKQYILIMDTPLQPVKIIIDNFLENVLSYSEIYFGPPRTIWSLRNRFSKIKSSKNR